MRHCARLIRGENATPNKKSKGFKTILEFIAEYDPPEYLIDRLIQRGYLYSLTARTGAGKTVTLTAITLAIAALRSDILGGKDIAQGLVLYVTFENPTDFRMKLMAALEAYGIDPHDLRDSFVVEDARLSPGQILLRMKKHGGPFSVVVVDTLAAGFSLEGKDSNDSTQAGEYVRAFRPIMADFGKPAVIIASHPVKNAAADNLIPAGSGAVLNEVDANLTLSKDASGLVMVGPH